MRFTSLDYLFTTAIVLVFAACSVGFVQATSRLLAGLPLEYRGILNITIFLLVFFFILGAVYPRILRKISPFREEAVFSSDDRSLYCFIWKQTVFTYEWTGSILSYVIPVILRGLFYSMLGAKIGRNVLIAGKIVEPQMVKIGNNSIVGDTSLLMAHAMSQDKVILKCIVLGDSVTIGAHAIVMPGVRIGNYSIIAVGSVVLMDTVIPSGEVWGGIPAVKIRDLEKKAPISAA
jgi:carbonic anhydrase/acetyltransferase-like protein (isoleucine patch superfamily)